MHVSLLRANPRLLRLIAAIMGSAPRLARILSRRSRVLDAVLDPGFFGALPEPEKLGQRIDADLATAHDLQEVLDRARVVGSEQAFLIGVRLISGTIGADQAGRAYAVLAEHLISALQDRVAGELRRQHGQVKGGAAAVVAMGKLGGREMTAASDLDLILIYDFDRETTQSDGSRPLSTSQYFTRLTQRLISAMTAPTAEGQLYEVDMRLRPSGLKGPVATQLSSFIEYQMSEAWTWEHMALTRGRVITGPPHLRRSIEETIATILRRPRDRAKVAKDVIEMRALVAKEKGTEDRWDLKQVRGGLVDLEFIAQFLQLVHAARHPEILDQGTVGALEAAGRLGLIGPADAETLIPAARLTNALTQVLRLCLDGPFDSKSAPNGLKLLLCHAAGLPDFTRLEAELADIQAEVARLFEAIVAP